MICPGCNKEHFNEISICVSCGTMIDDSVREELALKITCIKKNTMPKIKPDDQPTTPKFILQGKPIVQEKTIQTKIEKFSDDAPAKSSLIEIPSKIKEFSAKSVNTGEISIKDTNPTLLEFQNINAPLPDWRLQLQNAVKQRYAESKNPVETVAKAETISAVPSYSMHGNAALKVQTDEIQIPENVDTKHLRNALARIESSRRKFLNVETESATKAEITETPQNKNFHKLRVANETDKPAPISEELKTSADFPIKPKFIPKIIESRINLYDTSELDPKFPPAKISSSFKKSNYPELEIDEIKSQQQVEAKTETAEEISVKKQVDKTIEEPEVEEIIDDYAPFSLRFNAGLFDLVIGTFFSLLLLSPFTLFGGSWFTLTGFFAFLSTSAVVMFLYQTITIGVFGKTFGMHLFSLEMIDLDGEVYPTFHQAAVSSSIYLLSLLFFGMGFITTLFDEDKRSVHDIVSGTLVVKEI